MTLTREVYRSTWMTPVAGETSRAAAPKPRKRGADTTREQAKFLWDAMLLREHLTDKALARHLGLSYDQVRGQMMRMRQRGGPRRTGK